VGTFPVRVDIRLSVGILAAAPPFGQARAMSDATAPDPHPPTVWPAFQARDPRVVIDFLVALGFEETACYTDDAGVVQHAQLDWPEGGGVMLGAHKPDGPFTQQPGTSAAYVVTRDVDAVLARARAAGAEVPRGVEERDYGSRELALRDPEGNQWSFGTYPGEPRRV
jgi:uncharacterized glyoxalase superfamily protein PhnB